MALLAFSDRQFRLFFIGIFFAVQGIWMQRVTLAWIAWELTGSAGFVGIVAGLSMAPTLVAGPFFGVLADRMDIRTAAFFTNGAMILTLTLLALFLPFIAPAGVMLAALMIGVISSAHHPVRMSLGPRLVAVDMVQHVVSVTALNFNLARLVAPAVTGLIIAQFGAAISLWVAVAFYVPMIVVLMRLRPRALPSRAVAPFLSELREGVQYSMASPLVRQALLITVVFATILRGALEVLPVLADGAFERGAAGLGLLTGAAGAGALVAAMLKSVGVGAVGARIPWQVLLAAMVGQVAVVLMGLAPIWPLALAATAISGFCATWCGVSLQAATQTDLPDAFRGRVMSLWTVVGFGTVALGALAIGGLAEWIEIGPALVMAGVLGILAQAAIILGGVKA